VEGFIQELEKTAQDERLALVSYSSDTRECNINYRISTINQNLTSNYALIRSAMKSLSSKPVKGSTCISAGIDSGITVLTGTKVRPFAVKTMIVMTDGIHNLGAEPVISARKAATKDIRIDTITFSSDADIRRMTDVAAATGGRQFHAPTAADLSRIFKEIAATLPVLITD
jgi:Mg-chelatase subunit ChlD